MDPLPAAPSPSIAALAPRTAALPVNRETLQVLADAGVLDSSEHARALEHIGANPSSEHWYRFARLHLVLVGITLLVAGLICFVAANWLGLDRQVRLEFLAALMTLATVAAGWLGLETLSGRATALCGGLLFGPLIATYGQAFQTGADDWTLFALWAGVMTAYAAASRFSGAWILWLALVHLATLLGVAQTVGFDHDGLVWSWWLIPLDVAVMWVSERSCPRRATGSQRALPRTAMALALAHSALLNMDLFVSHAGPVQGIAVAPWTSVLGTMSMVGLAALAIARYRHARPDLFVLTVSLCGLGSMTTWWLCRLLVGGSGTPGAAPWFFIAAAAALQVWVGGRWLFHVYREHRDFAALEVV